MRKAAKQRELMQQVLPYTAYGHLPAMVTAGLGFNGELRDGVTQGYALGNGHRFYLPALMRFLCPDALSPFGRGGVNAYMYCGGDPVNHIDPSGKTIVKTGFGKFMKKNNIDLAHRKRAKRFLREPMQALAEQEGPYRFTVKVGSSYIEVNVKNGSFTYESKIGFDLLSEAARYQKHGIVVSLQEVPLMPAGRGFSSKMDYVSSARVIETPAILPVISQPGPAVLNLRSGSSLHSGDSSEA